MDLVAVNIGNSRISCGRFIGGALVESTHHETCAFREAALSVGPWLAGKCMGLASVVPAVTEDFLACLPDSRQWIVAVRAGSQGLVSGTYETMGADRVANAAAGLRLYGGGGPVVVVDMGTATTLTAVDAGGTFAGGMITLGLGRTLSALHREAAQLPDVPPSDEVQHLSPLTFDTGEAIEHGTLLAHVGAVEHWIRLARRCLGPTTATVATGGFADTILRHTAVFDHADRHLTLKGIYLIAEAEAGQADRG